MLKSFNSDADESRETSSSSSTTTPTTVSETPIKDSIMPNNREDEEEETEVEEITFLEDFIAGGLAGSASVIVGHPFDTIKVRLQTSMPSSGSSSSSSKGGGTGGSSLQSFGGVSSLFRGMVAPLSMAAVINAMIFSSYASSTRLYDEWFLPKATNVSSDDATTTATTNKTSSNKNEDHLHGVISEGGIYIEHDSNHENPQSTYQIGKNFVCGSIAGAIQTLVICPTEHVKCRLQTQQNLAKNTTAVGYKGPIDATKQILSQHGVRGLYRGFGCTCLREIPAFGAYFSTYDLVKDRINRWTVDEEDDTKHAWMASAIAGGVSGSFTWGMIYPVDVIKSRIQTSPLTGKQLGMVEVGRNLVKEYGWRYMYRGFGVTLARAFPVNGIIFPVYEFVLMELRSNGL